MMSAATSDSLTDIGQFYDKQCVLITGVTGFVGKALLAKLLRSVPGLDTIYVMMREKKGKDMYSRLDELLNNEVFQQLKAENPKIFTKIQIIAGDCLESNAGLNENDIETIVARVSVIFHVAATVRFDETLRKAVTINLKGTMFLTSLFRKLKQAKAMVHVSTTYSNCTQRTIEEKFYAPKITYERMLGLIDSFEDNDRLLESITPEIIKPWPNTYVFTKCVTEDYISRECADLAIGVFRPGISTALKRLPRAQMQN